MATRKVQGGARRATRKRAAPRRAKKPRAPRALVILAIALLIAGFIVRRTVVPRAIHYLAYRPPESPGASREVNPMPPDSGEKLDSRDRDQLNATIRHKTRN